MLLKTYKLIIAGFSIVDKFIRNRFFEESFLLAEINMEMILGIFFFFFSNVNIYFSTKEFIWGVYTITETMPIFKRIELNDKHNFVKIVLNENFKTFVIHVVA